MSRSRRKTPIIGNTGSRSEKDDKRRWHGVYRAHERQTLRLVTEDEDVVFPDKKEASNVWSFAKDGKNWFWRMKDRKYAEKLMRK